MNDGYNSKSKSPLKDYMRQLLSKQYKISSDKSLNNINKYKNDSKNLTNTFRKGINKEKPIHKYKTSKNSPNHVFNSNNNIEQMREILNDKRDIFLDSNYINNNNQIIQTNRINFLKDNKFDPLFMKKIQKIYSKQHSTQNSLSKLTPSNIFNSHLENSLKNNSKNLQNNISNYKFIKGNNSSLDEDNHFNPLIPNFDNSNFKEEKGNISSDFSQIKKYSIINSFSHGNFYSNSNIKSNNSSKGKNNNNVTLKSYLYNSLSKKENKKLPEKYKLNKSSGTFFPLDSKFDIKKKLNKTSYPSKNNSKKNQI